MRSRVSPKDITAVVRNVSRAKDAWAAQAAALLEKKLVGAALLAETRAVASGESPERLQSWLREHAAAANPRATEEAIAAAAKMTRFGDADSEKVVARLVDGILDGGDAGALLAAIAGTLHDDAEDIAALDVISGALAVAPPSPATLGSAVEIMISAGKFAEARRAVDELGASDAKKAALLRTYLDALTHPFDFRAASYLAGEPDDDAELSPLSLDDARAGVRSMARRVSLVVDALKELVGDAPWLPDVAALAETGAKLLADDYRVDVSESVPDLVFELRKEWARLSWAIAALGGSRIVIPTDVVRPRCAMDFVDTFTAARHDLLLDLAEGKTPTVSDALDEQLLASTWHGTKLAELDPKLAQLWLDETEATLAALRWAAGTVPTPWAAE